MELTPMHNPTYHRRIAAWEHAISVAAVDSLLLRLLPDKTIADARVHWLVCRPHSDYNAMLSQEFHRRAADGYLSETMVRY